MADYASNASDIVSVPQAAAMGESAGNNVSSGIDLGQQIQQQIIRTQAMQSDLQQKIMENHAAMTNHLTSRMAALAGMDDDDKKGPMWDMQVDALKKDLNSYGAPITPNALDTMLTDPGYSSRLSAALNATAQAGLDPVKQAAIVQKNAAMLGRPDLIQSFPEAVQKDLSTMMATQFKMNNQDIRKQGLVNNFVNSVVSSQKQFNSNLEYASNIQNLLKPNTPYSTGSAQVVAMDELTKLATNTVVRQFTYDNLKGTIPAPDQFMQFMTRKLENGQPLNENQVADVRKIANVLEKGADQLRLRMLAAKHNEAKGMINNSGYAGYEDQIRGAFDPDDWNKLENLSQKNVFNSQTQTYQKIGNNNESQNEPVSKISSKPSIKNSLTPYNPGSNQQVDSFLKNIIGNNASLTQVNKVLKRKNLSLSQDAYDSLKGGK